MSVWFTSDTHFGHSNIIRFCKRPFRNVDEMNAAMIKNWNDRVQPNDLVYHLGDVSFGDQNIFVPRLNGRKVLIIGNHDHKNRIRRNLWEKVEYGLEIKEGGHRIVLCHYAMRVWNGSHHGSLHFYGHSHGTLRGDTQSTDVGVDCFDYKPVQLNEILAAMSRNKRMQYVDHHTPKLASS